jgi:hypothetical protein
MKRLTTSGILSRTEIRRDAQSGQPHNPSREEPDTRLSRAGAVLARCCRCIGAALLFVSLACAQTALDGHWEGMIKGDSGDVRISLDLARNAQLQWIASMGASPQASGLVVMDLVVEGKSVKFMALEMMATKFDLALNASGSLRGTYTVRTGASFPVEFKRTGEAKVQLMPPIPAVSQGLEGDWEGGLGDGSFRILFHFKNQPDNTVKATLDTPATNGFGMPLDSVKQTGLDVEIGIRIAGASFKGTMNQERTKLAGQFMHESQGIPLTLRKK